MEEEDNMVEVEEADEEEETDEDEESGEEVEEDASEEKESKVSEEVRVDSFKREMHKAICADCKKECEVPFKPTEGRPVFCRDCYRKHVPQRRRY